MAKFFFLNRMRNGLRNVSFDTMSAKRRRYSSPRLMNLLIYHLDPTDRQIDRWLAPRSPLRVTLGTPPTCLVRATWSRVSCQHDSALHDRDQATSRLPPTLPLD
jgi:hypothetical protein